MVQTSAHPKDFIVRSPTPPSSPFDGQIWIDTSGNNVETNQYDSANSEWECIWATGPDTPDNPVEGTLWRDSGADVSKAYDGAQFAGIGAGTLSWTVTDETANRTVGTQYTNSTGSLLMVLATTDVFTNQEDVTRTRLRGKVDGTYRSGAGDSSNADSGGLTTTYGPNQVVLFVPDGSTYTLEGNGAASWLEIQVDIVT